LAWGVGKDCSFAGALEAAMAVTAHPYNYADLMGLSGLAFRLRWCNDETATQWCPSCAVGEMPDERDALARLTGWTLPTEMQFGLDNPDHNVIRKKVVAAIDAHRPVVAYASTMDMAVIYGYEDGGQRLLVSEYGRPNVPLVLPSVSLGSRQTYLGQYVEPPSRRQAFLEALKIAVRNWRRVKHDGGVAGRVYWYGEAAHRAWHRDLERFDALSEPAQGRFYALDCWNYAMFLDARRTAVAFLQENAPTLGGLAQKAVERAAGHYQHVANLLTSFAGEREILSDVTDWSAVLRQKELNVLAEAVQFESKAIADIELALVGATMPETASRMAGEGKMTVLGGVDRYRVIDPMFECVRIVLNYRGETYSPAYIQGISGGAFRIGGICPCAPTCACAIDTQDLVKLLGYEMTYLSLCENGMDAEIEVDRVIARVKDEIRAGRPAIVWHAFTTAEWDVVCGFDDEQGQFLGRGSYAGVNNGYASAEQRHTITCGAICSPLGAILVGEKTGKYDARGSEVAALREAVAHAHSTVNVEKLDGEQWAMLYGLSYYDRWIRDFRSDPPRLPTMGDRYCFGVYRSTHRVASEFMLELVAKYPGVKTNLKRAARHFVAEADALDEAAEMLFPGRSLPEQADADLNARAANCLVRARDRYAQAIDEIESTLQVIDE
jgi:hypothetical protein